MILKKFDLELPLNADILLKLYSDSMIDDIIIIALWSIHKIHKLVMLRNVTGKDDREKKLWHLFCNEIFIRLEINKVYATKKKEKHYCIIYHMTWNFWCKYWGLEVNYCQFGFMKFILICICMSSEKVIIIEINQRSGERKKNIYIISIYIWYFTHIILANKGIAFTWLNRVSGQQLLRSFMRNNWCWAV